MRKPLATEVVVIGGGIMGASTALFLRQRGVNVVLLERDLCGSRPAGSILAACAARAGRSPCCRCRSARTSGGGVCPS